MQNKWIKWGFIEGVMKASGKIIRKPLGVASKSLAGSMLATFIIGIIQSIGGLTGIVLGKKRILSSKNEIFGGIIFGLVASIMTVIGIWVFTYKEADVGIATFLITLAVVPGAIIDWLFFGKKLKKHQLIALLIFVVTAYCFLNFPPLIYFFELPVWILLSLALALLASINEVTSKLVRKMDVWVYNFWVGLTTMVVSFAGVVFFYKDNINLQDTRKILIISSLNGIIVLIMICAKLMSYKKGGYIALKSLVMQSTHLILATVFGVIFYNEVLTSGKIIGMVGFIFSFSLMNGNFFKKI